MHRRRSMRQAKWDLWHALKALGSRPKVRALPKTA